MGLVLTRLNTSIANLKQWSISDFDNSVINSINQPPNLQQIREVAQSHNATLVEYSIILDSSSSDDSEFEKMIVIWVIKPTGEIYHRLVSLDEFRVKQAKQGIKFTSISDLIPKVRSSINVRSEKTEKISFKVGDRVYIKNNNDPSLPAYKVIGVNEKTQTLFS